MKYLRAPTYRRALHTTRALIVVLSALLLLSWNYGARADGTPGDLDPGFGTAGKVMTDIVINGTTQNGLLYDTLAVQPDGKLIAAGSTVTAIVLVRYNPDGSLDPTFGYGGRVVTDISPNVLPVYTPLPAMRVSPAGRIVVAANIWIKQLPMRSECLIACYTADGNLDTSFGAGGKVMDDSSLIWDLLVQADGRIVIAAANKGLICFNPDGTRDMLFGAGGQAAVRNVQIHSLARQSDGRIIGAGSGIPNGFALARFLSDGSLDPSFGIAGVVTTAPEREGAAQRVTVAADGHIVAVGWSREENNPYHIVLMRYNEDGSLDTAFGDGGTATTSSIDPEMPTGLAVQPDGHIVISRASSAPDFELIRFTPNGGVDLSFGRGGLVRTDFSGRQDCVYALAPVGNDRIVAAGSSMVPDVRGYIGESCFALACYMTTGAPHEPDFELGFNSSVIHATRGSRPKIGVNLYRIGGFSGDVTVTPPTPSAEGIICTSPEPATVSGTTASWKFKIKDWAAPGPHQLTFIGRDAGGRERSATVTLFVD